MKNKRKHINLEERIKIENWLEVGIKQNKIAELLNRSKSTISKEIKRGMVLNKKTNKYEYIAIKANHKAYLRQYWKKKNSLKLSQDINLRNYVEKRIEKGWSPETISKRIKEKHHNFKYISPKAIRKYINKRSPSLIRYFFWERNNRKRGRKRKNQSFLNDRNRLTILDRNRLFPNLNKEYGYWEMDFIVSSFDSSVLLVLVEKKTKYTLIKKLENRKNFLVNKEVFSLLKDYSVLSITTDNDIAFTKYKDLERLLNINIFFTNPYASWEKGLVENTNRWIRQFIPKKTNISLLSDKYISKIEKWLNNWPRLILNSDTPWELFSFYQFNVMINSLLIDLPERVG